MSEVLNAGVRLWQVQRAQGTGLCIGADAHLDREGELTADFYTAYVNTDEGRQLFEIFDALARIVSGGVFFHHIDSNVSALWAGLTAYFLLMIDAAWACGVRIFKPQAAFYERLNPFGALIVEAICKRIHDLASASGEKAYIILDAKRGDLLLTQKPYFDAYLTGLYEDVFTGLKGRFSFDAMTVQTWMGEDVLTPGLSHFKNGKAAIVVTRTSNLSGTTLQDVLIEPNMSVSLSSKQEPFRYTTSQEQEIIDIIGQQPMAHEVMLYLTEKFSRDNGLNQDGVSPLFSVMGSTVVMLRSFRQLRPGGIALVPGFGAQAGSFRNIEPLLVREGGLAGHWGILSSSREHNFPWMKKFGGSGDPQQLKGEMTRVIDKFRADEKSAYVAAGVDYPF